MQFNLFYTCDFQQGQVCEQKLKDHILVYVRHGKIITNEEPQPFIILPGECVFIPKGSNIFLKQDENKPFSGFFLTFTKGFLEHFYKKIDKQNFTSDSTNSNRDILKLGSTPDTQSLYYSLLPYYCIEQEPIPEIMELKLQTGVYCLLNSRKDLFSSLFDFLD